MSSYGPYTFLPFEKDPAVKDPYASREDLPGFDTISPERISGYISYEVENLTPIAVGAGSKTRDKDDPVPFFKDGRGRYAIPGSTMRGFTRNHSEILSFSDPSDNIEDSHLMYRSFATNNTDARKDEYLKETKDGVKVGLIRLVQDSSGEHYEIQPVKEFKGTKETYFSVHEADIPRNILSDPLHYMYSTVIRRKKEQERKEDYFDYLDDLKEDRYRPYREKTPVTFDIVDNKPCHFGSGSLKGYFLNSEHISGKQHHYLVSKAPAEGKPVYIPREYANAYNADYDANCIQNRKLKNNGFFYALPRRGEEKIFFYKTDGSRLVGFGPTRHFRIFYRNTVHDGIPKNYRRQSIDYVKAMYGMTGSDGSYRSRLSFQNAVCYAPSGRESLEERVLLSPKATAVQMYLDQSAFTNGAPKLAMYNSAGMRLNGYKFYWKRKETQPDINASLVSKFYVLPPHSVFKGKICFENLSEDELGLLLLSLRYSDTDEKETFMLGKGKPYGFGTVTLKNIRLFQLDPEKRFGSPELNAEKELTDQIVRLKKAFRETIVSEGRRYEDFSTPALYGKYARYDDLEDYRQGGNSMYMNLRGYRSLAPLETLADVIEQKEESEQRAAARKREEARREEERQRAAEKEERKRLEKAAKEEQKKAEIAGLDRSMRVIYYGTDALPANLKDSLKSRIGARCHIEEGEKGKRIEEAVMKQDSETNGIAAFGFKMNNTDIAKAKEIFDDVYYVDKKAGKMTWMKK
ncbi:MAG: TIGR03986 family CRISPR-associated RAMP protein [Solobacterium sp.]|nr:TIGR03986 family CRISPR-associated RAMP protein [Solobacterium sp.]